MWKPFLYNFHTSLIIISFGTTDADLLSQYFWLGSFHDIFHYISLCWNSCCRWSWWVWVMTPVVGPQFIRLMCDSSEVMIVVKRISNLCSAFESYRESCLTIFFYKDKMWWNFVLQRSFGKTSSSFLVLLRLFCKTWFSFVLLRWFHKLFLKFCFGKIIL